MRTRRIFTPAYHPRRWGTLAVGVAAAATVLGLATALPTDLFGSAPREHSVHAAASAVRVVDGETLRLGEHLLRLAGVAVPERGQSCRNAAGQAYDCGAAAAEALARLVADRAVKCRVQGRDRQGRGLGLCHAGGVELNASLVAGGWAVVDAGAPPALGPLEAAARRAARGLWASAQDAEELRRGF